MNKVENIEQLHAERVRLKLQLKDTEHEIREGVDYLSNRVKPVLRIIDFTKNGIAPMAGEAARLILPFIVGRAVKGTRQGSGGAKSSILGVAATFAAEYLAKNINLADVGDKIANFIGRRKQKDDNTE